MIKTEKFVSFFVLGWSELMICLVFCPWIIRTDDLFCFLSSDDQNWWFVLFSVLGLSELMICFCFLSSDYQNWWFVLFSVLGWSELMILFLFSVLWWWELMICFVFCPRMIRTDDLFCFLSTDDQNWWFVLFSVRGWSELMILLLFSVLGLSKLKSVFIFFCPRMLRPEWFCFVFCPRIIRTKYFFLSLDAFLFSVGYHNWRICCVFYTNVDWMLRFLSLYDDWIIYFWSLGMIRTEWFDWSSRGTWIFWYRRRAGFSRRNQCPRIWPRRACTCCPLAASRPSVPRCHPKT